ncbi:ABC transporter ATP-binding protein/permease [Francisellaceae bacterium]|nr:ABC transporter ATP-binding protein/permease [Francisellaceae bacterium]
MNKPQHTYSPVSTWRIVTLFWKSKKKNYAYLNLIVLIAITTVIVGLNIGVTYWFKYFWNAVQQYDQASVIKLIGIFLVLATVFVLISVYKFYIQSNFAVRWREWLTQYVIDRWLNCKSYYFIENFDEYTDNPDQRIQEDVEQFTSLTTTLFLGLIDAVVTFFAFISLLWVLSGSLHLDLGSLGVWDIDGYLVWIALAYSIIGTFFSHKIGKRLVPLNYEKQHAEADFRYSAVHIRNYAECIAMYRAQADEKHGIIRFFEKAILINLKLINREKKLLFFTGGFQQISIIIPLIASLPMYFAKKIGIGGIQQVMAAFGQVESSLSYVVSSYSNIAQWRACALRLMTFMEKLDKVSHMYLDIQAKHRFCSGKDIVAEEITLKTQSGTILLDNFNATFELGKNYLLTGPSGSGKSTFIKTLAGIWPFFSGNLSFPNDKKMMYLPQESYFPLGTLRENLCYPDNHQYSDAELEQLLINIGLPKYANKLNEVRNWHELLSGGEQQKVAFVRVILTKPDWVFLDESTSSMDIDSERKVYSLLKDKLPNCSVVSIAHRESLKVFHDAEISLV